jgi:hypothetical protein
VAIVGVTVRAVMVTVTSGRGIEVRVATMRSSCSIDEVYVDHDLLS